MFPWKRFMHNFFHKLCVILIKKSVSRSICSFQERLLVPSSNPQFAFRVVIFSLIKSGTRIFVYAFPIYLNFFDTKQFFFWPHKTHFGLEDGTRSIFWKFRGKSNEKPIFQNQTVCKMKSWMHCISVYKWNKKTFHLNVLNFSCPLNNFLQCTPACPAGTTGPRCRNLMCENGGLEVGVFHPRCICPEGTTGKRFVAY